MADMLAGKVAIITGGASGIGLASARRFVEEGASVVVADINDAAGQDAAERLGESARYIHCDVTDDEQVGALVSGAVEAFGKLDVMFLNAAATGDPSPFEDVETPGFDSTMALVVRSVVLGHKHAARQFKAQGAGGSIVTTASIAALQAGWGAGLYTVGKHALVGLVKQATFELAPFGIRSNAVAPGIILTPSIASTFGVPDDQAEAFADFVGSRLASTHPIGRLGQGTDIANAALFFASDLSAFVTGTVLAVDGGASVVTSTPAFEVAGAAAQEWFAQSS